MWPHCIHRISSCIPHVLVAMCCSAAHTRIDTAAFFEVVAVDDCWVCLSVAACDDD